MSRVCFLATVAVWAASVESAYDLCMPKNAPEDTCSVKGSLQIISKPSGLIVDAEHCDVVYDKEKFQISPTVRWPDAELGETYTLVMLDPDAPNRTAEQAYLHWIVANIQGQNLKVGNFSGSTEITSYLGPAPPEGTGEHRYKFLVYGQRPASSIVTLAVEDPERQFFILRDWMRVLTMGSKGARLCGPLTALQFRSGYFPPTTQPVSEMAPTTTDRMSMNNKRMKMYF